MVSISGAWPPGFSRGREVDTFGAVSDGEEKDTAKVRVQREQLRAIGLFGGVSDESLDALCECLEVVSVGVGEVVMREGEFAREMFVVIEGELEVLRRSRGGSEGRVAMLGPRSWVGEMSILDVQPRHSSVRALSRSVLVKIKSEDLDGLYRRDMKSHLLVVLNIARELSRRLRVADGVVAGFLTAMLDENLGYPREKGGQ